MIIEIMRFRLAADADPVAFVTADRKVQSDFAYQRAGLLRRTTARGEDGGWIVICLWQRAEDADDCGRRWSADKATAEFLSYVDGDSVRTERYSTFDD